MIDQKTAVDILNQWIVLLDEIERIKIDCEMPPDTITHNLERRQQAIDRIQHLDASLMSVKDLRFSNSSDLDEKILDSLMNKGKALSDKIIDDNSQTIEIARKNRSELLGKLRANTLTKGYLPSNQAPKIRPPAILDSNA